MVMGKEQKTKQDFSEEAMKKDFDEKMSASEEVEELGGDTKDSSSKEDTATDTSAGDDKTESVKEDEEGDEPPVPRKRFKEVTDKAAELESEKARLRQENEELRRSRQETKKEEDPDELTEEEKLYFDDNQLRVIQKVVNKAKRQALLEEYQKNDYWTKRNSYFQKATSKFPELNKKDSELYKRADKIVREKYTEWSKDRKTYYIPPNADWLATLEAAEELREEKERLEKANKEEVKNKKQNVMVEGKGRRAPAATKEDEKPINEMSDDEIRESMEADFKKRQEDNGLNE
jgi:hypothetical protein